ncbi:MULTISPECIES: hypothetical protein [Actinomadura]|uniref:Uncharacterized protein n=1 Tax=Actinomadura yumaensis TaxID=111807 RepID=A0ABW2CUA2_9ACTN|nr:hypothetical protein [Actinomadura sp. J1-007]MWK33218.1 hypothetical protein [Actinomadura sp. J1-007]
MTERSFDDNRDPRDNIDDMGDDDQAEDTALAQQYVEDPPDDLVIQERDDDGRVGIFEYEREESDAGSPPWPEDDAPAESDAVNPTRRP